MYTVANCCGSRTVWKCVFKISNGSLWGSLLARQVHAVVVVRSFRPNGRSSFRPADNFTTRDNIPWRFVVNKKIKKMYKITQLDVHIIMVKPRGGGDKIKKTTRHCNEKKRREKKNRSIKYRENILMAYYTRT